MMQTLNPFKPEMIYNDSSLDPKTIGKLYVENKLVMQNANLNRHTLIYGRRGSGRSMLLRYMCLDCQTSKYANLDQFNDNVDYIGIYFECSHGIIRPGFFLSDSNIPEGTRNMLFEYYLILRIVEKITYYLDNSLYIIAGKEEFSNLYKQIFSIFSSIDYFDSLSNKIYKNDNTKNDYIKIVNSILENQITEISSYLRANIIKKAFEYKGLYGSYDNLLLPICNVIKKAFSNKPIYLLIDDGCRMQEFQQKILNKWIANRDFDSLCIKVTIVTADEYSKVTIDGYPIEIFHDYKYINFDDRAIMKETEKNFEVIINLRLKESCLANFTISDLLPDDINQLKSINTHKNELILALKKQYGMLKEIQLIKDIEKKKEMINKKISNTLPRILIASYITNNSSFMYCGIETIKKISSGKPRMFIEICSYLYDEVLSDKEHLYPQYLVDTFNYFTPKIQNRVILRLSQMYYEVYRDNLINSFCNPSNRPKYAAMLENVISGLSRWFKMRLSADEHTERQIISFSISDGENMNGDEKKLLDLLVRSDLFIKSDVGQKFIGGGGRETMYILNGILCPKYKLSNSALRGRMIISAEDFRILCKDYSEFLKIRNPRKMYNENQISIFDLED